MAKSIHSSLVCHEFHRMSSRIVILMVTLLILIVVLCSELRLHRRKRASMSTTQRLDQLIHLLQHPRASLVANKPLDALLLTRFWLLFPRAIFPALSQPKNMAKNLRSNTLLSAKTCNGNQARSHATHFRAWLVWRVGEETAVFLVYYEHWKIGMRIAELMYEFGLERAVDSIPKFSAACIC
jgi:hypothetical protein